MSIKIAPSVLASNFLNLKEDLLLTESAGADLFHVDIMDGSFVPPISFGQEILKQIRSITTLPLDVHLMINRPEDHFESFISAGADILTFHIEATNHAHRLAQEIRKLGAKVGIAVNPGTSIAELEHLLPMLDLVLIMTVNPGWGGQKFIEQMLFKIKQLRSLKNVPENLMIEVDGGINDVTSAQCVSAGANVLVAGTYIFSSKDYATKIKSLRS